MRPTRALTIITLFLSSVFTLLCVLAALSAAAVSVEAGLTGFDLVGPKVALKFTVAVSNRGFLEIKAFAVRMRAYRWDGLQLAEGEGCLQPIRCGAREAMNLTLLIDAEDLVGAPLNKLITIRYEVMMNYAGLIKLAAAGNSTVALGVPALEG